MYLQYVNIFIQTACSSNIAYSAIKQNASASYQSGFRYETDGIHAEKLAFSGLQKIRAYLFFLSNDGLIAKKFFELS